MPKTKAAAPVKDAADEQAAAEMVAEGSPVATDERDARIAALEAQLADQSAQLTDVLAELKRNRPTIPEGPKDYEWPVQTPEQAKKSVPQIPTTRVIKVGHLDLERRFIKQGDKLIVKIGQYRVPMAERRFDESRMRQEFHKFGLAPIEEIFDDAPILCQLKDCWRKADFDGAFCHPKHREFVLGAHDRFLILE